jgi:hypothetical protein
MEGDFNAANKMVYKVRMLNNARDHNLIPKEIFSNRNRMADDGMLCKTLFYNITQQARVPAAIALVDASNCYNRKAHAMAYLIFQAFGVPTTAIESMLGAIENMIFFLRTGFGNLTSFAGGGISIKMQGLCQGSIASRIGGYQYMHSLGTWKEKTWSKVHLPNYKPSTASISNPICR